MSSRSVMVSCVGAFFISIILAPLLGLGGAIAQNHPLISPAPSPVGITIERPVARPSHGPNGAVFMTFHNAQPVEDRLVAVTCDLCQVTEIHDHIQDGPPDQLRFRMRPIPFLVLPASHDGRSTRTVLASGGKHIMLMGIKQPLKKGETFPVTLHFQNAPIQEVMVDVTDDVPVAEHAHTTPHS